MQDDVRDRMGPIDAFVGESTNDEPAGRGLDPAAGRVRVKLGGDIATKPWAAELAAELEALMERALQEPDQGATELASGIEVSLRGLRLNAAVEGSLHLRIKEHVEARIAAADASAEPPATPSGPTRNE